MIFTSCLSMPAMDLARAIAQLQRQRCRVTSHPVAAFERLHHNPPCSGSARKGATKLISGIFQPAKVAVHPAGSERLAEPRGN